MIRKDMAQNMIMKKFQYTLICVIRAKEIKDMTKNHLASSKKNRRILTKIINI